MKRILKRGAYRPPSFITSDLITLTLVACSQAIIRGLDYATGSDSEISLHVVEKTMPLNVWSALFAGFGSMLVAGLLIRRHFVVWLGHSLLAVLYGALCLGIFIPLLNVPYWNGVRTGSVLFLPITFHILVAIRMGPRPLCPSRVQTVQITGAADAS